MSDSFASPGTQLFRLQPISSATMANAIPDFALAAGFLIAWIAPYTFGAHTISRFITLILLELSAMIAGIIFSPLIRMGVYFLRRQTPPSRDPGKNRASIRADKRSQSSSDGRGHWSLRDFGRLALQVFALSYYAFAILIAVVIILLLRNPGGITASSWWWFSLLLINRTFAATFSTPDPSREFARLAPLFGFQIISYVVLFMLAITLPLPRLGITPAVIAIQWPSAPDHVGEVFNDQPWRFLAWGSAYYSVAALGELFGLSASVPD